MSTATEKTMHNLIPFLLLLTGVKQFSCTHNPSVIMYLCAAPYLMYLRYAAVKRPLQPPCDEYYAVVKLIEKQISLWRQGKYICNSINRVKLMFMLPNTIGNDK